MQRQGFTFSNLAVRGCCTNLHHVFIDLLGVSVDQVDLLSVAVLHDLHLVGVKLVLVRHGGATGSWAGVEVLRPGQESVRGNLPGAKCAEPLNLGVTIETLLLTCQWTAAAYEW